MRFTQSSNPFFHRMQIVADRTALAHLPFAPRCSLSAVAGYRRDDTVLVDIQSKIEFFFHLSVFVCSTCLTATPNPFGVGAALLHLKKGE